MSFDAQTINFVLNTNKSAKTTRSITIILEEKLTRVIKRVVYSKFPLGPGLRMDRFFLKKFGPFIRLQKIGQSTPTYFYVKMS